MAKQKARKARTTKASAKKPKAKSKAKASKTEKKPASLRKAAKRSVLAAEAGEPKSPPPPAIKVVLPTGKPAITVAPGARLSEKPTVSVAGAKTAGAGEIEERKLTRKEIEEIEEELRARRAKILRGLKREINDYRERSASKSSDEADKASDAYDETLSFEIATTSDAELAQIEVALEKIARGTYGLCELCEKPISPSRMKAIPYAITCVNCRDEEERLRKRDDSLTPWGLIGDETTEEEAE